MTLRYVDPAASGDNNGTEWTHAWIDLQSAADTAVAGDIVYCRGTQNLSSGPIDFDTNSGDTTSGYIRFVGCNASGDVDGTRFVLACSTNAISAIHLDNIDYISIENFEGSSSATSGTQSGVDNSAFETGDSDTWQFINVYMHGFDGHGFDLGFNDNCLMLGCIAEDNDLLGFMCDGTDTTLYGCRASGNGSHGFQVERLAFGCLAYENTGNGFYFYGGGMLSLVNCVSADNTGDGVEFAYTYNAIMLGCRSTNNANGVTAALAYAPPLVMGCYVAGNTSTQISADCQNFAYKGDSTWNHTTDTDRDDGYVDSAGDDYNLRPGATLRSKAMEMP